MVGLPSSLYKRLILIKEKGNEWSCCSLSFRDALVGTASIVIEANGTFPSIPCDKDIRIERTRSTQPTSIHPVVSIRTVRK